MDAPSDWQISKCKLVQRGQYLLDSKELSDCKFIVGQKPRQEVLEGHKLFLAISSPVFKAMFYGSVAEETDFISICDVKPEAFQSFLKYIYTDKVELKCFESVCELYYCAKKYMLPYLVKQCSIYLCSHVSLNEACKAYEFAKLFKEPGLMEKSLNIICTKTIEVFNRPSWEEVELDTILTIFEKNDLKINSEIDLFAAAERWAKAECNRKSLNPSDTKCLRSVIANALSKIRFLTLTPQQFAKGVHKSLLLTKDEAYSIFINISLSESIPMPEEFSTNSSLRVPSLPRINKNIPNQI